MAVQTPKDGLTTNSTVNSDNRSDCTLRQLLERQLWNPLYELCVTENLGGPFNNFRESRTDDVASFIEHSIGQLIPQQGSTDAVPLTDDGHGSEITNSIVIINNVPSDATGDN